MRIEQAENGYIVTYGVLPSRKVFTNLLDVFKYMLIHFEGKSETFGRSSYGKVTIEYAKEET